MLSREFFQAFADALATSVSTITHWASGYNGPSDMERVKDMAEFLGVDYKDLLLAEEQEDAMSENMDVMKENMEAGMATNVPEVPAGNDEVKALYFEISKIIDDYIGQYRMSEFDFTIDDKPLHAINNRIAEITGNLQMLKYPISLSVRKQALSFLADFSNSVCKITPGYAYLEMKRREENGEDDPYYEDAPYSCDYARVIIASNNEENRLYQGLLDVFADYIA